MRMRSGRARRRFRPDWLTLAATLAATLCLATGQTDWQALSAVFAQESRAPQTVTLLLPAQQWFLLREGGRAVAACSTLMEAEMAREEMSERMEIARLEAGALELRVTAEARRTRVLGDAAGAVERTLSALRAMNALPQAERESLAALRAAELASVCRRAQRQLGGVDNAAVMGLAGLAGASRNAMDELAQDASEEALWRVRAALAEQYAAYVAWAENQSRATGE